MTCSAAIVGGYRISQLTRALVRFTPAGRSTWHTHANGQLLVCTDGAGLVSTRDGQAVALRAGQSVWTPEGEEHFHGGTTENMMCHYAIMDNAGDGRATTWRAPVTHEQCAAAHTTAGICPADVPMTSR